jgi:hypothetical protein
MRVQFRVFEGPARSFWGKSAWNDLFQQAAEFASAIGPERLINISHTFQGPNTGGVTVWYWSEQPEEAP